MDDKKKLIRAACKVVECKVKDLIKSRLTDKAVVLIVGPVGYKHIVLFEDLGMAPAVPVVAASEPPTTTQVEAPEPASTFEEMVPSWVWVILEREGLTDPEVLREKSDRALEGLEGLGRVTIKRLRRILDELG